MKENLADVTREQVTTKVQSLNTIAALVFHTNYFTRAIIRVLKGKPIDAHDKYNYDVPPIKSQQDWEALVNHNLNDAEHGAHLIEQLPGSQLYEVFADDKLTATIATSQVVLSTPAIILRRLRYSGN